MVEAVVEYDYIAQEPDELTIHKGDVIRNIIQKKGGWWEGTLRDKRGMFPDNFVTVIQKENKLRSKPNRIRQCRAIFSYHPAHDDELSLAAGDIIDIVCEVEEGWWKGRLGNAEGVFPSNFVHEIDPDKSLSKSNSKEDLTSLAGENDSPSLPPKPTRIVCQAKYPYDALNDDELTLREGDLITLISKDGQDRGWWRGELRGRIGVFPDNFVIVLPVAVDQNGPDYEYIKAEKKLANASHKNSTTAEEPTASKPQNIASQRKSLELKTDVVAPPVPGKKPNVPKKSPSSSSSAMASLKQKLVDLVDGQGSSRAAAGAECDFDQVERSAMLPDMRANRVKAPGRRPPSVVYRETEPTLLLNGNSDHAQPMSLSETSNDEDESEKKPKVREWEKHKAPWVEELKLNQAKRTPPLTPGSAEHCRLKLTPTSDKGASPSNDDSPFAHSDKESSPVDMTKSMSALGSTKLKTPTGDIAPDKSPTAGVALRVKSTVNPPITTTPARPQSIHGVNMTNLSAHNSQSPSPSPSAKPPVAEKVVNIDSKGSPRPSVERKDFVPARQYVELQERVAQMDTRMEQMFQEMQSAIEELKGKLQVETDMRRLLQAELEKVAQCVTQV